MGLKLNQNVPAPAVTPESGLALGVNPSSVIGVPSPRTGLSSLNSNGAIPANPHLAGMLLEMNCECDTPGAPTQPAIYLTSRPYPIEISDAIGVGFAMPRARLDNWQSEAMDVSFALQNASLRDLVHFSIGAPEAMDVSFALQGATLRDLIHVYTENSEALDVAFGLQSATLRNAVITYTMKPEALDIGFALVSATLQ